MIETAPAAAQRLEPTPLDDLLRELEDAKSARLLAEGEAAKYRRSSSAYERLAAAVFQSTSTAQLAELVLRTFLADLESDVGVLRLREGSKVLLSASSGLSSEPPSGSEGEEAFAQTIDTHALLAGPRLISASDAAALCQTPALGRSNLASVVCIPLGKAGAYTGVVCIGWQAMRALPDDEKGWLATLAALADRVLTDHGARAALEQAIHSRDEVLGIVAHDLRNPLNVIAAAANSLHQRLPDSLTRRPVERIIRAAQRAEHLIRDLLDIYAMEGGQFSIEKRPLDTTNAVLAALESQQGLAASSSVILASDLSPDLPAIEADEERLLEVLENLIGNAVKFSMAGGSVTVGASAQEGEVVIWVKDNGPGMAADHLSHLFDRFWQATKRDRRGTGLGLTICKGIVEAHGGRIWAESQLGRGTTVSFTMPAKARAAKRNEPVANILLVDDRPENLLSLRVILDRPEYRLVCASSGAEALSLALRESFAVALIDVAMPGMDGLEVAIHMKELERSRDIPIIFITAFGDDPEEIHRAYSAGGADYLVKPLDAEIVRKKVAVFVDLSRRRLESALRLKTKAEE